MNGGRATSLWPACLVAISLAISLSAAAAQAQPAWPASWPAAAARPAEVPLPAVVRIVAPNRDSMSLGSGSLVDVSARHGLVLTNWHVINEAAGVVRVVFPDGFQSGAVVLAADKDWDLAALAIWKPRVAPLTISPQIPRPGDPLTIAGYGSNSYRTATGRCTQFMSPGPNFPNEIVELAAAARQGDSGGPILNARGEVAGVLFGTASGLTSGSHCGRVARFLAAVEPKFRNPAPDSPKLVADVPASDAAVNSAAGNRDSNPGDSSPLEPRPASTLTFDPLPPAPPGSLVHSAASPSPSPLDGLGDAPSMPRPEASDNSGWDDLVGHSHFEQAKSLLAAIGLLALLLQVLRLANKTPTESADDE